MDVDGVFREAAYLRLVKRKNEPRTRFPLHGDVDRPLHPLVYRFRDCVINLGGTGTVSEEDMEEGGALRKIISELYHEWGILVRV